MSYSVDLDEQPELKLVEELLRRVKARADGLCDYCARPRSTSECKEYSRHHALAEEDYGIRQDELIDRWVKEAAVAVDELLTRDGPSPEEQMAMGGHNPATCMHCPHPLNGPESDPATQVFARLRGQSVTSEYFCQREINGARCGQIRGHDIHTTLRLADDLGHEFVGQFAGNMGTPSIAEQIGMRGAPVADVELAMAHGRVRASLSHLMFAQKPAETLAANAFAALIDQMATALESARLDVAHGPVFPVTDPS